MMEAESGTRRKNFDEEIFFEPVARDSELRRVSVHLDGPSQLLKIEEAEEIGLSLVLLSGLSLDRVVKIVLHYEGVSHGQDFSEQWYRSDVYDVSDPTNHGHFADIMKVFMNRAERRLAALRKPV